MTSQPVVPSHDPASLFPSPISQVGITGAGGERLPIFRWDSESYTAFYAPGRVCVVPQAGTDRFLRAIGPAESGTTLGSDLWRRARQALAEAERWREGPFVPECLTLYMNNECNLSCVYCHTDPVPRAASRLDLGSIAAAAEVVAAACRDTVRPFVVVFHGGGEPALHREQLEQSLLRVRAIAAKHDLETFLYIATNGILSESDAVWLAREFDLIGLSCDGPPEIHNRQRPRWDGSGSLHLVQRTGRILREEGCRLHLRTTITRGGLAHQAGIARYICQRFSPEEIRFEPVYLGGRAGPSTGLETRHAADFVAGFLEARSVAREYGVPLTTSGTRPGSLHGPFCHLFRNVINLVPGGGDGCGAVATVCFKLTDADGVRQAGAAIGAMDPASGRFEIDERRLQRLRQRLDVKLPACDECFNFYHCARQCPDSCPLDSNPGQAPSNEPGFRCRVQKALAAAILQETAARLWIEARRAGDGKPRGTDIL